MLTGNFGNTNTFEILSYTTNTVRREDGRLWRTPPARLPSSETEGRLALEVFGNTHSNAPVQPINRIPRSGLEESLYKELLELDRHPIISLIGPGGIGKTTVALATITKISRLNDVPYQVMFWISSRDIDLLDTGPKEVLQKVFTKGDIARYATELLQQSDVSESDIVGHREYFQQCLTKGVSDLPTLFVFDNFETIRDPVDVFNWIDCYIRPPNKALITSRIRDFRGDFPIEIGGMSEDECGQLIHQHASVLGISDILNAEYKDKLIQESDGHPYVIKILLGQVAREKRIVTPKRIFARSDDLLRTLFERTFAALSPASQRVFLLLCSCRLFVPAIAIEAVLFRPDNSRIDVTSALEELQPFSLVDRIESGSDEEWFVGVSLAAFVYGRQRLETSPYRIDIESDRQLLRDLGVSQRSDILRGVFPRIEKLITQLNTERGVREDLDILEYLASKVPNTYLLLAESVQRYDDSPDGLSKAKDYVRRFLQTADVASRQDAWIRLADLCNKGGDSVGEIHAICEASLLPTSTPTDLGQFARRLNHRLYAIKTAGEVDIVSSVLREHIRRVAEHMDRYSDRFSATGCSALAWLYANSGDHDKAYDTAMKGLQIEPNNEHCRRLVDKWDA